MNFATSGVSFELWRMCTGYLLKNGDNATVCCELWRWAAQYLLKQERFGEDTGEKNAINRKMPALCHHKSKDTGEMALLHEIGQTYKIVLK